MKDNNFGRVFNSPDTMMLSRSVRFVHYSPTVFLFCIMQARRSNNGCNQSTDSTGGSTVSECMLENSPERGLRLFRLTLKYLYF